MTDRPIFFDPPTLADRRFREQHDDECEAEWVAGAASWTLCRCAERLDDEDD